MTDQTVGERLRRFRIEILGMSQLELAAKLGIDPASLNRIERGKRRPDHNTYTLLATRTVPMAPAVAEALRTIRADTIQAIDGTVFRIGGSALCEAFRTACRHAGITGIRWHDLRHTAASHMVMAGVPLRTVAEVLGHRSLQMIMRYAHLSPEHMREAVNTLGERLFAAGEKQV